MTQHAFKMGDEVPHKTGKAKMIYVGDSQLGDAPCGWTNATGQSQRASFAYAALAKCEDPAVAALRIGRA